MVRLAEARARIDMREVVTREDANDVVAIMKESLYSTVIDEYGSIQVKGRKKGGKHAEAKRFLTTMSKMANAQGRKVFSVAEMYSIADDIHLQVDDMKTLIEKLNDAGELLKKGNGMYALA
jgi:DNA helicase MCM8